MKTTSLPPKTLSKFLHFIARKRLAAAKLTVVDATNVQPEARKPLVEIAREYHVLPVAIVLNLPERLCHDRNQSRPDRASVRTLFASNRSSCAARCADWNAKVFAMSSFFLWKKWMQPR